MGTANKLQRLTLEQLIAAKEQREREILTVKEIEVPPLNGTLLFKRPSDEMLLDMMNVLKDDQDTKAIADEFAKIIYNCCEDLHNKELYEEMEVGDPVDIVYRLMGPLEIIDLGDEVCNLNKAWKNFETEIKNA